MLFKLKTLNTQLNCELDERKKQLEEWMFSLNFSSSLSLSIQNILSHVDLFVDIDKSNICLLKGTKTKHFLEKCLEMESSVLIASTFIARGSRQGFWLRGFRWLSVGRCHKNENSSKIIFNIFQNFCSRYFLCGFFTN
jgi:hypothetical protein